MKKRIFLICSALLAILGLGGAVYAYYTTIRKVDIDADAGHIEVDDNALALSYKSDNDFLNVDLNTPGFVDNTLTCYASKIRSYDTLGYVEFSKLKSTINYKANINTKIRVKIQDVWISNKVYSTGREINNVIAKQQVDEDSQNTIIPFTFSSNWEYDLSSGYAYYKKTVKKGNTISLDFIENYNASDAYYYPSISGAGFHETILVQLSFKIDIVQANRASSVWGV